jgi:hypothetical protein
MSFSDKEQLAKEIYEMGHGYCVLRMVRFLQTIEKLNKELEVERQRKQDKDA